MKIKLIQPAMLPRPMDTKLHLSLMEQNRIVDFDLSKRNNINSFFL